MPVIPPTPESPVQEVVNIRNSGSYTIPEEARKAHRLLIDVEVISVTRNQYSNLMYIPNQGEYGNVTFFSGASLVRDMKLKFPAQRLIDWVNLEASIADMVGRAGFVIILTLRSMAIALGLVPFEGDRQSPNTWGYPITHIKFKTYPDTQIRVTCQWYPFVPFSETEPPTSDLDDPANGEDEYPYPRRNPREDPWNGNADSSGIDESRDPRDFDEANEPAPPPPLGDDCTRDYFIQAFVTTENPDGSSSISRCDAVLRGEILSVTTKITSDGGRRIAYVLRRNCSGTTEEVNLVNAPVEPPFSLTVESVTPV